MIREMRVSDWDEMMDIYKQSLEKGVEVSIFIDQNHTKEGIGTELLSKLMEEAEKEGYWTLYSAIFSVNEGSIKLYKKCDLEVNTGERKYCSKVDRKR